MDTRGRPETVSELYPRQWLRADDLGGKAATVTITEAIVESFRAQPGDARQAVVLSFAANDKPCARRMICNKTQTRAIMALVGSERFDEWPGHTVTLAPATAPNGKPTIAVSGGPNGSQ